MGTYFVKSDFRLNNDNSHVENIKYDLLSVFWVLSFMPFAFTYCRGGRNVHASLHSFCPLSTSPVCLYIMSYYFD